MEEEMALQQAVVDIPKNQPQPHWKYSITTGNLYDPKGVRQIRKGYSGAKGYKNQPLFEALPNLGAIPEGWYEMTKKINDIGGTGISSIVLKPTRGTVMFGRTDFRIHGDNGAHNGTASHGCIIYGHATDRDRIWNSGVHLLEVVR
jgi:hypothetical protein